MSEDRSPIADVVRTELEKGTDSARREVDRRAEEALQGIDRRADVARGEVGARLIDLTEEYFPEEVARRRRRGMAMAFAAGVGAGAAARHFVRR